MIAQLIAEVFLGVQLRKSRRLRLAFYGLLLLAVLIVIAMAMLEVR